MAKATIKQTEARFAALDFSEPNAILEELQVEIDRLSAAIGKADARCSEIAQQKVEHKHKAREVADALLGESTAIEAVELDPGPEQLEAERLSLRAAINDLSDRRRVMLDRRRDVQRQCEITVSDVAAPLVAALRNELEAAGERIADIYASLHALSTSAFTGRTDLDAAELAVQGLFGQHCALDWRREMPVPAEVSEMLRSLAGKGPAFTLRTTASAFPSPPRTAIAVQAPRSV